MKLSNLIRGVSVIVILLSFAYSAYKYQRIQWFLAVVGFLTVGKIIYNVLVKELYKDR